MSRADKLNVYFYALYENDDHSAHSGLVASECEDDVRSDIAGNYIDPRYVTIYLVPDLVGVLSEDGCTAQIMPLSEALQIEGYISCDNCRKYGDCLRNLDGKSTCCEDWEGRE